MNDNRHDGSPAEARYLAEVDLTAEERRPPKRWTTPNTILAAFEAGIVLGVLVWWLAGVVRWH